MGKSIEQIGIRRPIGDPALQSSLARYVPAPRGQHTGQRQRRAERFLRKCAPDHSLGKSESSWLRTATTEVSSSCRIGMLLLLQITNNLPCLRKFELMNKNRQGAILVADDDPDCRAVLARRLRRRGFDVLEAPNGTSALSHINAGRVALALLDSLMPDMSGLEILDRLRAGTQTSHIPAIMVTGKSFQEDIDLAVARGADGYVTKPVDFATLLALIERTLGLE